MEVALYGHPVLMPEAVSDIRTPTFRTCVDAAVVGSPARSGDPDATTVLTYADAGDWESAAAAAGRVASRSGPLTPAEAWPTVMVLYLQGDVAAAEAVLARAGVDGAIAHPATADGATADLATVDGAPADLVGSMTADLATADGLTGATAADGAFADRAAADDEGADSAKVAVHDAAGADADRALLAAWEASIAWAQGNAADCRRAATRAFRLAHAAGDPRALAAAHTVRALLAAAVDDRRAKDRHGALALAAAERSGDRTLQLRVRVNRASQRLEEGDLAGARRELDAAAALVARPGPAPHPAIAGLALHNHADLDLRAGRLTVARDGFRAAAARLQRAGAATVAYPLTGLGQIHELRGDLHQARAAYEEAALVADGGGLATALGPALCGLARVLGAIGDPVAGHAAARALAVATGPTRAEAYAAAGWAAAATDEAAAQVHADNAIMFARTARNPAALADALELAATIAAPGGAEPLLADAARVYADIGDVVGAARVALAQARAGLGRRPAADRVLAEHRLRMLGADPFAGTRSLARSAGTDPVCVRMLGSFAVVRSGEEVPATVWQSRKARDLLKLIVARRGRPSSREALGEALWPGADNVANRLSIALSVLRTVLDPDRTVSPGHYVVASPAGVAYDPRTLCVDVDVFLQLAAAGLGGAADAEARLLLAAAAAAYTGDVLDDEPDLAVAGPLREEARAAYLAVMRTLGALCARAGDTDGAVRAWLRVLERDPYEEDTAMRMVEALVAGGRHGEAARHHRRYAERMRELGVVPRDFPVGPTQGRC
ncbi:hypothetical protein KRMM14A1259_40880 [Krasilnikovia sp. MM14-A1259]